MPPPAIYLDGDTIDLGAFRGLLVDSLRATLPHFRAFPDSLERARIDSIRQRIEREMRVHQDEMRQFTEAHRERIEHLQRELHERMLEEQPQRLRDQAEALRRQAERLEEQAREMERRRAPEADTSGTSGLRGAPPFDAAPWTALRGGSHAVHEPADPVTAIRTEALAKQAVGHARVGGQAVVWRIARTAAALGHAALSASHQGSAPSGSGVLWRAERTGEPSILR
jgi:exonuclease VII large subunit